MIVRYYSRHLAFHDPFTISKGTKTHQPTFITELEYKGLKGYGEAPAITYYNITVEQMATDLELKKAMVEKFALTDPERYWHFLHHLFPNNPFLVCALDMAGWDLMGKMTNKSLNVLWQTDLHTIPQTDYTIGIDTEEAMIKKIKGSPWPIYKIKVGFQDDMEMLANIRKYTDAVIRVDANAGWTLEQAMTKMPVMKSLGVEFVEQPLAKDNWDDMRKLFEYASIPIFADETCVSEHDVEKCAGFFHGINIKLTKCSGPTPARRMIKKARQLNLKIMLGCMNESTIGTAAMVHLSPLVDYLDADGPLLLKDDLATGLLYNGGNVRFYGQLPGLGVSVSL